MGRPPDEKVVVGYCRPSHVHGEFMERMLDLQLYDVALNQRIVSGGGRISFMAGCNLSGPRNEIVRKFLTFGQAEWLWMVDTDMTFDPDVVERLLEHADPETAPIVGGLCFGFNENGMIKPTLFGLDGDPSKPDQLDVTRFDVYPENTMFQVVATGAACMLIHKSVFERMLDFDHPSGRRGFNTAFPWFQELEHNGKPVGEDIAFCWRAGLMRIPVYVNTAVEIGHIKERLLTAEGYRAQERAAAGIAQAAAGDLVEVFG
jgi:hypothetical protein